jgi:hypothetical protein
LRASLPQARAADAEVPLRMQIDLLARVIPYDRNFAARAGSELRVLVLVKPNDADSAHIGAQLDGELHVRDKLAQFPLRSELVQYTDSNALAARCRARHASIVYLSSGLTADLADIAGALRGVDVLSVASFGDDVKRGVVLGFSVSSGKPKLLVNLGQARKQHVDFRADLLRIAQVVSP